MNEDLMNEEVLVNLAVEVIDDPEGFIKKVNGDRNVLSGVRDLLRRIKNNLAISLTKSEKARLDNAVMVLEKYMQGKADEKGSEGVKHSVEVDVNGEKYVRIDKDILKGVPKSKWKDAVKNCLQTDIAMGKFFVQVIIVSRKEYLHSTYTKWLKTHKKSTFKTKYRLVNNIDEIVQNAKDVRNYDNPNYGTSNSHNKYPSYNKGYTDIMIDGKGYTVRVVCAVDINNNEIFYDIVDNVTPTLRPSN